MEGRRLRMAGKVYCEGAREVAGQAFYFLAFATNARLPNRGIKCNIMIQFNFVDDNVIFLATNKTISLFQISTSIPLD
jgi:hypothetical protein